MFTTHPSRLLPVPCGALTIPDHPQTTGRGTGITSEGTEPATVRFSLIVPTFNESGNLEKIVGLLCGILDEALPEDYELIIVDDDSPDRTWQQAQALMTAFPQLRVMRRVEERGLSTAVIRGWQAAQGEVLGVIDGDLQHPPETLQQLLDEIAIGADLAVASRHVNGGGVSSWSLTRRFLSRGAQFLGLLLLPQVISRVSDPMSGYFLVRRSAIANHELNPLGYKILIEVIGRGAVERIAEVGYVFQEREEGESKVTWKQYTDYLHHLLKLRIDSGRLGRLRRRFNFPFARFARFGLVGLSGVVVDIAVFWLLRTQVGLPIARSTMLSAEVAVLNNFFWNDRWTFGDLSEKQPSKRQRLKRFIKFNLICLMGIILQALLVSALHDWVGMSEFIAKLGAIAIATVWNFWLNLKLGWRVTQVE